MMAEALGRWLREEMELPPSAAPSPAALRRLCSGPTAPVWDYVTRHVRNHRNVKKIRGNLRWHGQELQAAPDQQGALRAALQRLRNELHDLGDAIADAQETAQRLEASLGEGQSRRWAELERGAELRLLGAEPGPAALPDGRQRALRALHKRPGPSRAQLSAILASGAEPEVLVSIKALCKAKEAELRRPRPHRAANHPEKAPDWLDQAEAVLIGHSPGAVLWALEALANQSTSALLAGPAPSAEAPPTLRSLLQERWGAVGGVWGALPPLVSHLSHLRRRLGTQLRRGRGGHRGTRLFLLRAGLSAFRGSLSRALTQLQKPQNSPQNPPPKHPKTPKPQNSPPKTQNPQNSAPKSPDLASKLALKPQNLAPKSPELAPKSQKLNSKSSNLGPESQILAPELPNLVPKCQNLASKSSNLASKTQNLAPESQNFAPKSSNLGPKSQNLHSKSQNLGPGCQNLASKFSNLGPKNQNLASKSSNLDVKSQNLDPELPNLGPKSPNLGPKPQNLGLESSNLAPKSPNLAPKSPNLAPKSPNLERLRQRLRRGRGRVLRLQQRLRFLSAATRGRRAALRPLQEQVVGVARAGPGSAPPSLEGAWLRRQQLFQGAQPRPPEQATPPLRGLAREMGVAQGALLSQAAILRQQLRQGALLLRRGAGPLPGAEPEPQAPPPVPEGVAELLPRLRLVRECCQQRIRDWPRLRELVSQWWAQPAQWALATPPGHAPFSHWLQRWRAAAHSLQATPTPEEATPTLGQGEERGGEAPPL